MIRRPPRSTPLYSSAASDVYKRQHMRKDDGRAIPSFVDQALHDDDITIFGDGKQTRSICYVDDLSRGIYALMQRDYHEPVNIGNPSEMSMIELAEKIVRISESKSTLKHLPPMKDDPKVRRPDISKARELLGWEPQVDPEVGLKRTIEWFREEKDG